MTVLEQVLQLVRRRRSKFKTTILDMIPPVEMLNEICIVGDFSIATLQTHQRFLTRGNTVWTAAGRETPSALARDYLKVVYGQGPKIKHAQAVETRAAIRSMPAFVRPITLLDGWYVDVRATYLSIMDVVGWNVDYWPPHWLAPGRAPFDFPWREHKGARNCLVSTGASTHVTMYYPDSGFREKVIGSPFANLQLFRLIIDVLHSIAAEMVSAGAVYVATDGYIMPSFAHMGRAVEIIESWGLESSIKGHGRGVVRGPGTYSVGQHKSRKLATITHDIEQSNIHPPEWAGWLKERFGSMAGGRPQ